MTQRPNYYQNTLPGVFEGIKSDYKVLKTNRNVRRRTGLAPMGAGADYHFRSESDHLRLMEMARDASRNSQVLGRALDVAADSTMGDTGFGFDSEAGFKEYEDYLQDTMLMWMHEPEAADVEGEDDFASLSWTGFRSTLQDGDFIGVGTDLGALQCFEAHRARTPNNTKKNCVFGFLKDELGRRKEVWITKENINPLRAHYKVGDSVAYQIRDDDGDRQVFQPKNSNRLTFTRGITALAPIFITDGQFEDIQFAKLVQQQVVSCITFLQKVKKRYNPGGMSGHDLERFRREQREAQRQFNPGGFIEYEEGEEVQGFSPNVPNPEFFEHMRMVLQLISINLGLPINVLLLDPSDTNFSGWRGAIDQARIGFKRNQQMMIRRWHRPIARWQIKAWLDPESDRFDERLAELAAQGYDQNPKFDPFRHKWQPTRWNYIEPLREAQADKVVIDNHHNSPRRVLGNRGLEHRLIVQEIAEDNGFAIEQFILEAQRISELYPDVELSWQEVAFLTQNSTAGPAIVETDEQTPQRRNRRSQGSNDD